MTRALIGLALVVLLATASGWSAVQAKTPIAVTRDSGGMPSGCTPRETAELLVRFADAVTAGDLQALDRLFAIEDPPGKAMEPAGLAFRWYSVTEGRDGNRPWRTITLYDRDELLPYFAERHRQRERWQLLAVDMGVASSLRPGAVGITYWLRRDADDLPSSVSRLARGKGEIDCPAQRIFVWSMGQDADSQLSDLGTGCPLPSGWTLGNPIVACTRSNEAPARSGPTARAFAPDFRGTGGAKALPQPCSARKVASGLRNALTAFNAGNGVRFAGFLTARGRLHAPQRVKRNGSAAYRVSLLLSSPGLALLDSTAMLTVDCRSGLVHGWTGPHVPLPG